MTIPHFANSSEALSALIASTNIPVEPKRNKAASASSGPEYSNGLYLRPVSALIFNQISVVNLRMSCESTGRVAIACTEDAEDAVGWLSELLSRTEEPVDEPSPFVGLL